MAGDNQLMILSVLHSAREWPGHFQGILPVQYP
jgi:hypothetical protein